MKLLITGVTGFLGGCVAQRLASAGHDVRGLVREGSTWADKPATATVATGDVTDPASLRRAMDDRAAIVHCAAMVKPWAKDKAIFDRVNVGGLENVLAIAEEAKARIIYTSSFIALGPTDGATFDEETPRATDFAHNDYERTKWAADQVARRAAAAGARLVRLYPGVTYGPGAVTQGNHVVQNLLLHARGKLPGMLGPGDRRLSLAYVDDVTNGFLAAVERARDGSAYILGGDNRTLVDLFTAFERETGNAPPKMKIPYAVAGVIGKLQRWRAEIFGIAPELTDEIVRIYAREWAYASDRARRDLGYKVTPLEEGIAKTVAWLRARGDLPAPARASQAKAAP